MMHILIWSMILSSVSGHGTITKPIARSLFQNGIKPGGGLAVAGSCRGTTCAWYTQTTTIPGKTTNCDAKMRTMGVNCDSTTPPDWTCNKKVPWCAPGTAWVKSPCGVYGGGYEQNTEDMLRLPAIPERETWIAGGTARVAFSVTANHGGGYTYRLCKADSDLSETCFQQHILSYTSDRHWVLGTDGKTLKVINATRTNRGTYPVGSVWTRNPFPQEEGLAPAPLPGVYGRGPFNVNIMDEVKVPHDLSPGHYVLSWRWDAEAVPQVWQGCSDVNIVSSSGEHIPESSESNSKQMTPCNGASVGLDVQECAIWQELYDSLGGPHWSDCSGHRLDPCGCTEGNWGHFIACSSHRDYKHLQEIYLMKNNVSGLIPASVSNLTQLGALDLNSNDIYGTIPKEIGYMKNLRALWLDHNPRLTGSVPSTFSNLNLEEAFELHLCNLTGTLPALPFDKWHDCVIMGNNFDCPLPRLGALWCAATCK